MMLHDLLRTLTPITLCATTTVGTYTSSQPLTTEGGPTASGSVRPPHTVVGCHGHSVLCPLSKSCYLVHGLLPQGDYWSLLT